MDAPQTTVPAITGIDLNFRPRTYFGPIPAETHLLAHVTGHERREFVRAQLAAAADDPMLGQRSARWGRGSVASVRQHLGRCDQRIAARCEASCPVDDDEDDEEGDDVARERESRDE